MNRRTMNRNCCLALGIVFAMAVPHIAEAQGFNTCGVQATPCAGTEAWGAFTTEAFVRYLCGLGFVEFAFTGCLLTCLMPSGRRRIRK